LKKTFKIILNFVVFPSIGILLLYLAFKNVDIEKLWNQLKGANFYWVGLSLVLAVTGFYSRALRWKILIEPLGYNPSNKNTFLAVFIAYFANIGMPRLGEITRCGSLNKTDNIPVDKLFGTVITERVIDFLCLLIIIAFVLVVKFKQVSGFFIDNIFNPLFNNYFSSPKFWIIFIISTVTLIALLLLFRKKLLKVSLIKKMVSFFTGLTSGLKSVFKMKKVGLFFFHTILIWAMYILMTYVAFFSIKETSNLSFLDSIFILTIGGLGMSVPVTNGFGAYHWIVALGINMLLGIQLTDISNSPGLLFATICHESQTLMVLLLGPIALFMVFFAKKKKTSSI
jgi:uncharacterized protein (TIRG00374 family)